MVEQLEDRVVPAFVIHATFASNIQTDPNAATIEASINRVIAAYENTFTDNVTVNITFQEDDGLGSSRTPVIIVPYTDYLNAIKANATSADDTTAQATLPAGPNQPIAGTASDTFMLIPNALARALRLGGVIETDSTIGLNTSIINLDRTGPQDPAKFDLMDVTATRLMRLSVAVPVWIIRRTEIRFRGSASCRPISSAIRQPMCGVSTLTSRRTHTSRSTAAPRIWPRSIRPRGATLATWPVHPQILNPLSKMRSEHGA
jgi:hypothetical protein